MDKKRIRLGIIGLGQRGRFMLINPIIPMKEKGIDVVAICDNLQDRIDDAIKLLIDSGAQMPFTTTDYKKILERDDVDAVYIAVSWEAHVEVAIDAMKAGKYIGLEAGGAYSLDDCYKLIHTYEETGTELMFLENCCYGKRELMALNMVRKGVFGNVMHCNGAYCHDLRKEIIEGKECRHYRLRNYIHRNCENYPTHDIGPIAKLLDINNGNRFVSLSSFASASKGLHEYSVVTNGPDHPLSKIDYAQGDIVTTIIKCAAGQTVCLTLDTTLPRAYSRRFEVHGTKGMYMEDNDSIFLDDNKEHHENDWIWKPMWGNAEQYEEQYNHPLWKEGNIADDVHGGIDNLIFEAFFEAVRTNSHPPIDVYDAATYMCITVLSEESILNGGAPVAFPDFTGGKWTMRTNITDNKYTLDKIDNGRDIYFVD